MSRPQAPDAPDSAPDELLDAPASEPGRAVAVDLASLPIVGLTRRRMALMVGALLAVWILITFARQVAEASESVTRAADIATGNAVIRLEVAAMERELEAIGRQRFIEQQARGYGVGNSHETPFALAPDAPPLAADAPGSAAVRVGADIEDVSPFERWLTVLFGPSVYWPGHGAGGGAPPRRPRARSLPNVHPVSVRHPRRAPNRLRCMSMH